MLAREPARLSEFKIRVRPARRGQKRQRAVEHHSSVDIGVEALVDEIVDHTARLRDAERESRLEGRARVPHRVGLASGILVGIAQKRNEIARGGQANVRNRFVRCGIDQFVERAAIESGRCRDLDVALVDEMPARCRQRLARIGFVFADGERRSGGVEQRGIVERLRKDRPRGNVGELFPAHARDRLSVRHGDGHVRSEETGSARRVHLPAAPGNGIATAHQETVAGILRGEGIAAFVKPQDRVPAAVDKIVDQPAVPLFRVHRLEDQEVHAVLDVAFGIERCAVYIDDARVAGRARIEFAIGCSGENFVRLRRVPNDAPP